MFLTSEAGNFLIIAIIAVFVIALALVIYLLLTTKNEKKDLHSSNQEFNDNLENKNLNVVSNENIVSEVKNDNFNVTNNQFEPVNNQPEFNLIEEAEKRIEDNVVEEKLEDNLEKNDFVSTNESSEETNIESVLKEMQKDLDSLEKNEAEIARYEEEEEKNAIISYKELMKYKDNQDKVLEENTQDKDILLEDKDKAEIKKVIENNKETVKKFKRSEFISPIFGYNDDSNVTYREIKRPPRKEKIVDSKLEWESDRILKDLEDSSAEVIEFEEKEDNINDNTTKFLDELVDFRKKLD